MQLIPIPTGNLKLDGGAMFGVVPKSIWSKAYPADENNMINLSMRCLLIVDGDRKILIDNGLGDKQSEKFYGYYYLNGEETLENSLNRAGFNKDDITDMILTHLHFDHCGGSVIRNDNGEYKTAFKNATYWISQAQWEWATKPNPREKASFLRENILPIQESGQLKLVKEDSLILPNVKAKLFNGHTDGQLIPYITYKDKTIIFMADLLPTAAHVPLAWVMGYDTRPLITMEEKADFIKDAADNKHILFLEHDLYNECCTLKNTDKGVRLDQTFALSEVL